MSATYRKTSTAAANFAPAREAYEQMVHHLESPAALGMTHVELEEFLIDNGREMQRRMYQAHLNLRGTAERPVRVVGADDVQRNERRRSTRGLMSLLGEVVVPRLIYQATDVMSIAPLDASLNLPSDSFSLGVRRYVAEDVSCGSFDDAVERVCKRTGAKIAKRQVMEVARRAAVDFDAFYATRPVNDVREERAALLVLSFDGAGIVMLKDDLRTDTRKAAERQKADPRWPKRLSKGQKKNHKRMAQVAAVYEIAPFPRTPEDIIRELRPVQETTPKQARPKPIDKRVWASVARESGQVVDDAFQEALRRDPRRTRSWVVLVDGNKTQLAQVRMAAERAKVEVTVILDVIHVLEYLWRASYCFHKEGSPEAATWVHKRLVMLLSGTAASNVAAGMRRSATLQKVPRRDAVDECATYLCNYNHLIRYHDALASGLPIATGVIEGACRYLVRDRMDKTGARWSLVGAEAVLKLRALRHSGDWETYWKFHVLAEHQRNHALRYAAGVIPDPLKTAPRAQLRRVK